MRNEQPDTPEARKWTRELPKVSGVYWIRGEFCKPEPVHINEELRVRELGSSFSYALTDKALTLFEWQGPIVPEE